LKTAQEQRIVPWNQNRGDSGEDESEVDDVFCKRVGEVHVSNEVDKSRFEKPPVSEDEFFEDYSPIRPKTNLRLRNSTFFNTFVSCCF